MIHLTPSMRMLHDVPMTPDTHLSHEMLSDLTTEDAGDFTDGLYDYDHTHESALDGSPAMVVTQTDTTITLINEDGYRWTDPLDQWRPIHGTTEASTEASTVADQSAVAPTEAPTVTPGKVPVEAPVEAPDWYVNHFRLFGYTTEGLHETWRRLSPAARERYRDTLTRRA